MHTGMMWFLEKTPKLTLAQKIQKAVDYFHQKYGRPDLCLVNPGLIDPKAPIEIKDLTVRPYRYVPPSHIWIGVEDKPSNKPSRR